MTERTARTGAKAHRPRRPPSELEETFAFHLRAAKVDGWVRQHAFHPGRQWRFDFAWPAALLAVEIDGGTWSGGGHVRGRRYEEDCEKADEAVVAGWRLLRFTTDMVGDGRALDFTLRALASPSDQSPNGDMPERRGARNVR